MLLGHIIKPHLLIKVFIIGVVIILIVLCKAYRVNVLLTSSYDDGFSSPSSI